MERQTMIRHQMYRRIEAMHIEIALLRVDLALRAFNPSQPRVPAGRSDGGQWTSGGDTSVSADDSDVRIYRVSDGDEDRYRVDLRVEEGRGGHTLGRHIGKTDDELFARLAKERAADLPRRRFGSFDSIETANRLVNQVIDLNKNVVDQVASGKLDSEYFMQNLGEKTGREAYATQEGVMYMRDTYCVGLLILHDPNRKRGFRVRTAFPRNDGD
jgi:hypothetical protein